MGLPPLHHGRRGASELKRKSGITAGQRRVIPAELFERERYDDSRQREVNAAQPEGDDPDDECHHAGDDCSDPCADPRRDAEVVEQQARRVGADSKEHAMPQ